MSDIFEPIVTSRYTIYRITMDELPDYVDKFGNKIEHIIHHLRQPSHEISNCLLSGCVLTLVVKN